MDGKEKKRHLSGSQKRKQRDKNVLITSAKKCRSITSFTKPINECTTTSISEEVEVSVGLKWYG